MLMMVGTAKEPISLGTEAVVISIYLSLAMRNKWISDDLSIRLL